MITLSISIIAGSCNFAFATTYPDTQSSNSLSWYVPWQGTSRTIARGQSIGNILASMARWLDSDAEALYNRMGGLSGDIQDVVTAIESIPGANDYSTVLSSIDNKIKDYTNNFASVENKLQSIINNLVNVNTGLTNIKSDTGSIVTNTSSIDTELKKLTGLPKLYNIAFLKRSTVSGNVSTISASVPRAISYSAGQGYYFADLNNSSVEKPLDYLSLINSNILGVFSSIYTPTSRYRINRYDGSMENTSYFYAYSLSDMLYAISQDLGSMIDKITFVIADDDTIAAKNANKPQEQAVLSEFTGTGNASASVGDYSDIASGLGSVKGGITTNVSVSNAFGIFNNSDGYNWFTSNTTNNLNTSGQNNRKSANEVEYTYYNSQLEAIYNAMGVKYD